MNRQEKLKLYKELQLALAAAITIGSAGLDAEAVTSVNPDFKLYANELAPIDSSVAHSKDTIFKPVFNSILLNPDSEYEKPYFIFNIKYFIIYISVFILIITFIFSIIAYTFSFHFTVNHENDKRRKSRNKELKQKNKLARKRRREEAKYQRRRRKEYKKRK